MGINGASLNIAKKIPQKISRLFGRGVSADEISRSLVSALRADDAPPCDEAELALRLAADPGQLASAIDELLAAQASARRQFARLLPAIMQFDGAPTILSLGTHCFTSSLLQRWGLRRWSGPFDWVFSSVPMITHCINDDFAAFLDREQYLPVALEHRRDGPTVNRVDHSLYRRQFGVACVFNHHDVNLDEDYAYFVRCVARFRNALHLSAPKIFVVARPRGKGSLAELQALRTALAQRCKSFSLVCFEVMPTTDIPFAVPRFDTLFDEESLHVLAFTPSSTWEPLRFVDALDEHAMVRNVIQRAMEASR